MIKEFIVQNFGLMTYQSLYYVYIFAPVWLPVLLLLTFWTLWVDYIRSHSKAKAKKILLEIKLPKEITKSPAAMEVVLTALYQSGAPKNYFDTYWTGLVPPWFSLELVSIGGHVRFFIWSFAKYKKLIEHQIYAQYPDVEVYEVPPNEDYMLPITHDLSKYSLWGTYFRLGKANPYPIKTYVDYNLSEDPKEEFKVDPMTSVLEYLGSVKKGEQVWIQLVIRAHREETIKHGRLHKKEFWTKEIDKVLEEERSKLKTPEGYARFPSKVEGETLSAIERGKSKFPFEVAFRGMYFSEVAIFDAINITGLIGSVRQYSTNDLNIFKLGWFTDFDNPWQDFRRYRRNKREKRMIEEFKKREFYTVPQKHFILTTEEIATLFHFPGQVAATPTFPRITSRKGEAPPNLPR